MLGDLIPIIFAYSWTWKAVLVVQFELSVERRRTLPSIGSLIEGSIHGAELELP